MLTQNIQRYGRSFWTFCGVSAAWFLGLQVAVPFFLCLIIDPFPIGLFLHYVVTTGLWTSLFLFAIGTAVGFAARKIYPFVYWTAVSAFVLLATGIAFLVWNLVG